MNKLDSQHPPKLSSDHTIVYVGILFWSCRGNWIGYRRDGEIYPILPPHIDLLSTFVLFTRLTCDRSDNAYIIRSQPSKDGSIAARKFKLNAQPGERIIVKR